MTRAINGPVVNAILRRISEIARIGGAARQKPILIVEDIESTDWASLTFVGHRHTFDLRLEGASAAVAEAVALLTEDLANADIPLGGGFIAEIRCVAGDCLRSPDGVAVVQPLRIEALSIRD